MGTNRLVSDVLPSSNSPIGMKEFVNVLSKLFHNTKPQHGFRPKRIGLAISGGVDSMALASLCSQIQGSSQNNIQGEGAVLNSPFPNYRFQAFVVDHGVRQDSEVEAEAVSKALGKRGIQTQVLKIQWNGHHKPAEMPNFESLARKHRFQVLGRACKDSQIDALLVAHHQDDQAETVMMRLIAGHRMLGLMGIKGSSEIPECYGIHGVHESGGADDMTSFPDQRGHPGLTQSISAVSDFLKQDPSLKSQLSIEAGGVRIYRPLLTFSKARLRATCETERMEWFEDHTNKDPTITTRNAVRYLYSNHSMPAALTAPALLALSQKYNDRATSQLAVMNSWLAQCSITKFETRTGIVRIRFNDISRASLSFASRQSHQQIAAALLRRVIMLVTPEEHVPISSLHGALQRVYQKLFLGSNQDMTPPNNYTVAGVQFSLVSSISNRPPTHNHEWLISRQSYTSSLLKRQFVTVPSMPAAWSPWILFDGRFWIHLQNSYPSSIFLRPFRKEDLKSFIESFSHANRRRLRHDLKRLAPGYVRWTLPAIVMRETCGKERVLALPTLDYILPEANEKVKWDVRYKKVDLEGLHFRRIG